MEQLSKSEKQIMDTFWNSPQPLPASDLLSACVGRTWKARSVFPLVKKLIEKGALAEVGCVRRGKTYARTFQPAFSRVEYWAEIIKQEDMDGDQLSELTDLLAQHKRSKDPILYATETSFRLFFRCVESSHLFFFGMKIHKAKNYSLASHGS